MYSSSYHAFIMQLSNIFPIQIHHLVQDYDTSPYLQQPDTSITLLVTTSCGPIAAFGNVIELPLSFRKLKSQLHHQQRPVIQNTPKMLHLGYCGSQYHYGGVWRWNSSLKTADAETLHYAFRQIRSTSWWHHPAHKLSNRNRIMSLHIEVPAHNLSCINIPV